MADLQPFLTFNGETETAMNYYAQHLPETKITRLSRYGEINPELTGELSEKIMYGELTIAGKKLLFLDMDAEHPAPAFNWANSFYLACQDEAEFDEIFEILAKGGEVMMGPMSVGAVRKCAWIIDQFGVVWQPVWQ